MPALWIAERLCATNEARRRRIRNARWQGKCRSDEILGNSRWAEMEGENRQDGDRSEAIDFRPIGGTPAQATGQHRSHSLGPLKVGRVLPGRRTSGETRGGSPNAPFYL